jgi:hypothetical protein
MSSHLDITFMYPTVTSSKIQATSRLPCPSCGISRCAIHQIYNDLYEFMCLPKITKLVGYIEIDHQYSIVKFWTNDILYAMGSGLNGEVIRYFADVELDSTHWSQLAAKQIRDILNKLFAYDNDRLANHNIFWNHK